MQNLQTLQQIAESIGVSRQGVSKFLKKNFPEAKVGKKWDISHSGVFDYIKKRGVDPNLTVLPKFKASVDSIDIVENVPATKNKSLNLKSTDAETILSQYMNLPLGDLIKDFGEISAFGEHAKAHKNKLDAREKELKIAQIENSLVSRDLVDTAVFKLFEELSSRLLIDAPNKIAIDVYAHNDSGDPIEDAVKCVRDQLSKAISRTKKNVCDNLKGV